jgi:hypothetical protein
VQDKSVDREAVLQREAWDGKSSEYPLAQLILSYFPLILVKISKMNHGFFVKISRKQHHANWMRMDGLESSCLRQHPSNVRVYQFPKSKPMIIFAKRLFGFL